jgi:hypothetical protein
VVVEVISDEASILASGVETTLVGLNARSEKFFQLDRDVADVVVAAV